MISKTRGIVLRNTNYAENSIVTKIFTSEFGIQAYLVNGVRNNKGAIKISVLQPLNILEMEVYHKSVEGIQRIKEARPDPLLMTVGSDINKSCISMFMLEILNRTLNEEAESIYLYDFVEDSIIHLDTCKSELALFPHYFLLQLSKYLGFFPELDYSVNLTLDLHEGRMLAEPDNNAQYALNSSENELLKQLGSTKINDLGNLKSPRNIRSSLLNKLIVYYQLHMAGNAQFKSLEILHQLLHVESSSA